MQPSLFMPLLTRLPKNRVKAQVISLSPGCVRAAVLRQNGVPTHDVAFSRRKFSAGAFKELVSAVHAFRPDVIQAWGHTAQIASAWARKRCDWEPTLIWSVCETAPIAKNAGFIDRQKLKLAAKLSSGVDRIVYTSESAAAHHRRAGFPDGGHEAIGPGVDAARFKPEPAARIKVREKLEVPHEAFVIGMVAPFQPEFDHATFLKGVGELIKTNPNLYVLLAGHGVQRGNAPLMAMLGGGALGTRTQLLGEWSDLPSLFNACDLVCSSALNDASRMTLAMAMLCGVPCVATGMGAQGELIGQHGVAVEPGSPAAFIRGISKILQMPQEKRLSLAQGARKYALQNFVYVRALQKYLELYSDLVGREALASDVLPAPKVEDVPPIAAAPPPPKVKKEHAAVVAELADPDSLEAKVAPLDAAAMPKWRVEQERARAEQDARLTEPASNTEGDVLEIFEEQLSKPASSKSVSPMNERARGVADEDEELLPVEVLTAPAKETTPVTSELKVSAPSALAVVAMPKPASAPKPESAPTAVTAVEAVANQPAPAESLLAASENTWTGEQVVLALEDPSSSPIAPKPATIAEPGPKQESLFDFELMPDEPTKAVNG